MAQHPNTLATVSDLYRVPDDGRHYELVHGQIISEPPPGGRHGRLSARLVGLLDRYLRDHPVGVLLTCDPGFILSRAPDTVRAPDVAVVARARYLRLEDESRPIPGAPELAIEVLSPGDRASAVQAKVADFLAAGCSLVWIVDPDAQQVRVYRDLLDVRRLSADDCLEAQDLLPGFRIRVGEIFEL